MDNIDIQHCVEKDSKELAKIYAGVVTIDDVTHMNSSLEMFRQFLISSLLSNKIQNFPIGFIVNTGSHKSGGVHWQGIYFDNKHHVYLFDSYGRETDGTLHDFYRTYADILVHETALQISTDGKSTIYTVLYTYSIPKM